MAQGAHGPAEFPSLHTLKLSPSPPRPPSPSPTASSAPPPPRSSHSPTPLASVDEQTQPPSTPSSSRPVIGPSASTSSHQPPPADADPISYRAYQGEEDLEAITKLVDEELSEPYNLYTYRYFLDEWSVRLASLSLSSLSPRPWRWSQRARRREQWTSADTRTHTGHTSASSYAPSLPSLATPSPLRADPSFTLCRARRPARTTSRSAS